MRQGGARASTPPCECGAAVLLALLGALERKRAEQRAKSAERALVRKGRERAAKKVQTRHEGLDGHDFRASWAQICTLKIWNGAFLKDPPVLKVRKANAVGAWGHAKLERNEIVVSIGVDASRTRVEQLLIHELCHRFLPDAGHRTPFIDALYAACREYWNVRVQPDFTIPRGKHETRCYAMEDAQLIPYLEQRFER